MLCAQTAADSVIKIIITRGEGGRGYKAANDVSPTRILSTHPFPDYPVSNQSGVTVRLCEHRLGLNPTLAGIKHMNRLDQVLARNEWADDQIKEGLMLDVHDRLIEGTMTNLFMVKDQILMTPQLTQSGIEGIMRANILQLAVTENFNCVETDLSLHDLKQADEVFLCNSLIGIWPVTELTVQNWKWSYGSVTRRLQAALKHF